MFGSAIVAMIYSLSIIILLFEPNRICIALRFPGNYEPDQRRLRVHKWKNKEIPGRSEESDQ